MIKIAIRADSNPTIGMGHVIRCLALAEELDRYKGCSVSFITRNKQQIGDFDTIYLNTKYDISNYQNYHFPSIRNELSELKDILKHNKYQILIVDNYGVDSEYFRQIRQYVSLIGMLEDFGNHYTNVDLIINSGFDAGSIAYPNDYSLLGNKYVIMRKEFKNVAKRKINDKCNKIAITSGGSDPLKMCDKIAVALQGFYSEIKKKIIVGSCFQDITFLEKIVLKDSSFELLFHADMKSVMLDSDIIITASGGTLYELAATGTPSISYILFTDQKQVGENMGKACVTRNMGEFAKFDQIIFRNTFDKLLLDVNLRIEMSRNGQQLIDGKGSERAAEKIIKAYYERKELWTYKVRY